MIGNAPTPGDAPRRDLELLRHHRHAGQAKQRCRQGTQASGKQAVSHVATGQRVDAVAGHLRERSGEPVQTDLTKRGWRSDEGQRCRAVHTLRKPERRTISPAPMSLGMGTGSALGWINLTTATPPALRFDAWACRPSPFGDPKGHILRVSFATGFNPAVGTEGGQADPGPCQELPGSGPSARFGSGASPRLP